MKPNGTTMGLLTVLALLAAGTVARAASPVCATRIAAGGDNTRLVKADGTVTGGANLVYPPNADFQGVDSFQYLMNNGEINSNVATGSVNAYGNNAGLLVDIVVNDLLYTVLSNEVQRLKADLTNEGYTVIITSVSAGTSAASLWTHLNSIYQTNKWLVGALLIGNVAKMAPGGIYSDMFYWNMGYFQSSGGQNMIHNIWVGRFTISASVYGGEVDLIRYALDANHYYRTGQSRLPKSAYVSIASDFGGESAAANQVSVARQIWPNAYVGFNVNGSDLICELSHGNEGMYQAGMDTATAHAQGIQSRAMFCNSCSSGYPDGVVNHQLFTRHGGNLISVGASTTTWGGISDGSGPYTIFTSYDYPYPAGQKANFRALLAAGETWGMAMIRYYPFLESDWDTGFSDTMIYGDLSMKPLATPPNAMPVVTSFAASKTTVRVGEPVTFTVAVSDSDATACTSPYVNFKHRVEWYMEGWNYGKNNPVYTTDDTVNSNTKTIQYTNTFFTVGTRTVRALVMDEWRAVAWQEIAVSVLPPVVMCAVTVPTNGAVVIEGTNLTITADATVSYGSVSNVEFTLDGIKIATDLSSPYSCVWTNAIKGAHVLTAKATDGAGNFTNSTAVSLSVLPIVTSCTITAPANGAVLKAGTNLAITATATVLTGTVSKVEFFHDGMKIGGATSAPYSCVWSNVPSGFYALTARATQSDGRTGDSAAVYVNATASGTWEGVSATGGTMTNYTQGGTNYRAHIFTSSGTFAVASGGNVELLVVGGGGGGGRSSSSGGGGGGAGGLVYSNVYTVTVGNYAAIVGAGGAGKTGGSGIGSSGSNSAFAGITALGGGYGGYSGNTGGSGGSGGGGGNGSVGGTGAAGQGNDGGTSVASTGGGGGGAGAVGGNASSGVGGKGGAGQAFNLSGVLTYYAGGGGGGGTTPGTAVHGGGNGTNGAAAGNGVAGSGGGGGGTVGGAYGGNGGSGIVIVRYAVGGYEAWRQTHFDSNSLINSAISGATADPDHDGLNNEQEYWAGTNPTNASSRLAIIAPSNNPVVAGGGFVVRWQSVTGKTYSLLAATNLMIGFTALTNGLPATPTVNVYTDKVNGAGQKFYRVEVE